MGGISRRDFARAGGALAFVAMLSARNGLAAEAVRSASTDPLSVVHPELRQMAAQMQSMASKAPPLSEATLSAMRSNMASFARPVLAEVPVAERRIAGAKGAPDVTVHVINARPGSSRPAILHTHGGGYVLGSAKIDIRNLQEIAQALDCAVVTVDYRLAPETRWQGSLEDNYAGLKWLYANAAELGVDRSRIAVMGESAGGGHAALLAIAARDRGEVPLAAQVLVYPMLDDRTGSSRQVPAHIGALVWTAEANRFGWRSFLGQAPGGSAVPAVAVPARVGNLAGLPPTFIGTGSIDLFVDEDIDYARRLVDAGVPTELVVVPGAFHGFDVIAADTSISKQFTAAKLNALRRAFRLPVAA